MSRPLIIENGTIQGYPHDFHVKEIKNVYELRIILPGINKQALYTKVEGDQFMLRAMFTKEFRSMFRRQEIVLKGTLPGPCEPHSIATEYRLGILIITITREMDREANA